MEREFPQFCAEKLKTAKKIYVIANNTWLSCFSFAFVNPKECDIIVQFNDCIHFDRIKHIKCRRIYVFREKESTGEFWGIDKVHDKIKYDYNNKEIVFVFNRAANEDFLENSIVTRSMQSDGYSFFANGAAPPSFEAVYDVQGEVRFQPTTGYITLRLLYEYVRTNCQGAHIVAVGFSGKPVGLWRGHQIGPEREWLMKSGIRRVHHSILLEASDWSLGVMRIVWRKLKSVIVDI